MDSGQTSSDSTRSSTSSTNHDAFPDIERQPNPGPWLDLLSVWYVEPQDLAGLLLADVWAARPDGLACEEKWKPTCPRVDRYLEWVCVT